MRRDHLGWGGKRLRGLHNCGKNNTDVVTWLLLTHTVLLVECMHRRATGCLTCQDLQPLIQVALSQSPAIVGSKFRIGLLQARHTRILCMCLWFELRWPVIVSLFGWHSVGCVAMHVVSGVCSLSCCLVHDSDTMKNGKDLQYGASVLKFKVRARCRGRCY